jgi:hypothetical protein
LIPFEVYIPDAKVDEKLPEKLKSEASGILNWMLAGLEQYRRHGLMEPDIVLNATEAYRGSQDWLNRFLDECTEKRPMDTFCPVISMPNTRIGPRMSGSTSLRKCDSLRECSPMDMLVCAVRSAHMPEDHRR